MTSRASHAINYSYHGLNVHKLPSAPLISAEKFVWLLLADPLRDVTERTFC